MKKREVTDVELKNIIALRQLGSNWTKIAVETKVERRAAKRAYEEWEHDQEIKEQQAVRFRIEAEAWHEHMNDLVSLAAGLVSNLRVPPSLADLEKDSEQFFSALWKQDLLQRYFSPETGEKTYPGDLETYWREQELLFASLRVHTKGKVRWEVLDINWKNARNACAEIIPRLRTEISEVVGNSIIQPGMVSPIDKAMEPSLEGVASQQRIEGALLKQIWQSVLLDKLDLESPRFETEIGGENILFISRDLDLRSRDETVLTFNVTDKGEAEKVTRLCSSAVDTLIKGKVVQSLYAEVQNIQKAHKELAEMFIPVKLKPIIIHSRCELCPV